MNQPFVIYPAQDTIRSSDGSIVCKNIAVNLINVNTIGESRILKNPSNDPFAEREYLYCIVFGFDKESIRWHYEKPEDRNQAYCEILKLTGKVIA